ncbi:uncharacterized protein adgrg2a isoform X2 [Gouania willdenowi]|uniref:uncharacterized protein adgrg2a isoform X2 n=1 Tax=Gouania willdenowi TaxID=441366 RepID=UPI0010568C32|nr:adhesion G-protein coupled receptor G2 isoform X2 [Gouania willdenowi]
MGRMISPCLKRRWRLYFFLMESLLLAAPPPKVLGSFLGDTKAVLNDCGDRWILRDWASIPQLLQMTVCVNIRVVAPGSWVAFTYSSVWALGLNRPEFGLEGDEGAIYVWLLRVRHNFPLRLAPQLWHRLCLKRDVPGNTFSLEVDEMLVAKRTVIAQAIPPHGSLWLGCHSRGPEVGVLELYLFRMWADLREHELCEDGSVIGWDDRYWKTSPKARERDPYLMCAAGSGFGKLFGTPPAWTFSLPAPPLYSGPANQIPTNTQSPASTPSMAIQSRVGGASGSRVTCDSRRICSDTNVYFLMPLNVEVKGSKKTEQDVHNWVSKAFACQSNSSDSAHPATGSVHFCHLQVVNLSCSEHMVISQAFCDVLLLLSRAASACDLQRAGDSALQQPGEDIQAKISGEVERVVKRNLCDDAGPTRSGFVRCSSVNSIEDICLSGLPLKLSCLPLDPNSHLTSQPKTDSCSRREPHYCDCTAFCDSTSHFYALIVSIQSANINLDLIKSLLLKPHVTSKCSKRSRCKDYENIFKVYKGAHVECDGSPNRLYSCQVILEMSKPVDGCSLYDVVLQSIDQRSMMMESPLHHMMVCGPPDWPVHSLLVSNLTWVSTDLSDSDVCRPNPSLFLCDPSETLAIIMADSCPSEPPTAQTHTQTNNIQPAAQSTQQPTWRPAHTTFTKSSTTTQSSTVVENTTTYHTKLRTPSKNTTGRNKNTTTVTATFSKIDSTTSAHNVTTVAFPKHVTEQPLKDTTTQNKTSVTAYPNATIAVTQNTTTTSLSTKDTLAQTSTAVTAFQSNTTNNVTSQFWAEVTTKPNVMTVTPPTNSVGYTIATTTLSLNDTTLHDATTSPPGDTMTHNRAKVTLSTNSPHTGTTATVGNNRTATILPKDTERTDTPTTTSYPGNTAHKVTTVAQPPRDTTNNATLSPDFKNPNVSVRGATQTTATHNHTVQTPSGVTSHPYNTTPTMSQIDTNKTMTTDSHSKHNVTTSNPFVNDTVTNTSMVTPSLNDNLTNNVSMVTASLNGTVTSNVTMVTMSPKDAFYKVTTAMPSLNDTAINISMVTPSLNDTVPNNVTIVTMSPNDASYNATTATTLPIETVTNVSMVTPSLNYTVSDNDSVVTPSRDDTLTNNVTMVTMSPNDASYNATTATPLQIDTVTNVSMVTPSLNDTVTKNVSIVTAFLNDNVTNNVSLVTASLNDTVTTVSMVTASLNDATHNVTTGNYFVSDTVTINVSTVTVSPSLASYNVTALTLSLNDTTHNVTTVDLSLNNTVTNNISMVAISLNDTTLTVTTVSPFPNDNNISTASSSSNNGTTLTVTHNVSMVTTIVMASLNDTVTQNLTMATSFNDASYNVTTVTLFQNITSNNVTTALPILNDTLHIVTPVKTTLHNITMVTSSPYNKTHKLTTDILPMVTTQTLVTAAVAPHQNDTTHIVTTTESTTTTRHTARYEVTNSQTTVLPTTVDDMPFTNDTHTTFGSITSTTPDDYTTLPAVVDNTSTEIVTKTTSRATATTQADTTSSTTLPTSLLSLTTSTATEVATMTTNPTRKDPGHHSLSPPSNSSPYTSTLPTTAGNGSETQEELANLLIDRTQNASQLNSSQVSQVVGDLEKLLNASSVSLSMGQKAVRVISNLMGGDSDALSGSAHRLIRLVEDLGLKLMVDGVSEALSSSSLVLAVMRVDGTSFPVITMDIVGTDDVQLGGLSRSQLPRSKSALGSVYLPSSLVSGLSPAVQRHAHRVHFSFYTTSVLFQDKSLKDNTTVSPVLTSSVADMSIRNLSENIELTIRYLTPVEGNFSASCVFWDFALNGGGGGWSSLGCSIIRTTAEDSTCSCNHLTAFAILLDLSRQETVDPKHAQVLTFITYIGCGISAIFLAVTLLTYLMFDKLQRDIPAKILVQLCFSLLLLNLVFLLDGWLALYPAVGLCISTAFFLHYFLLTSFTWAGLEALHMYLSIVRVFVPYLGRYMLKFSLIGWGFPLIVVIIVISIDKDNYGLVTYGRDTDGSSDDFCWLRSDVAFYVGVVAYFLLVFVLCLLVFVVVMYQLARIKKQNPHNQFPSRGVLTDVRSVTGLVVLLGLTWGFALFAWGSLHTPFVYLFSIFNSLQGFFIFVFHCAVKDNVRRQWRTYLCCGRLRLAENSEWSRTATHNRNATRHVTNTAAPFHTSRSSSVISDATNSSGCSSSLFADSGISDGSNCDVVLNELHRRNLALQGEP